MRLKLNGRVWNDFRGNVCTNSNFFEMKLGDIWEGGQVQSRVMALESFKKELVALGVPAAEVEEAFVVETTSLDGTTMDYAGNIRRAPVEVGAEVGPLTASVEVEFGQDRTENYIFSAAPKTLHRFKSRASAEKMFKWAVLKYPKGNRLLFQRCYFLVVEVWTSSNLVFLKCDGKGKLKIQGRVEPPLSPELSIPNKLAETIAGLKLAQVGASLQMGPEFLGLQKVVRDSECCCVVKVRNNRPLKPSRKIDKTGFFNSADEALQDERLLDEDARQLKWEEDSVLDEVVMLDDAKLCEDDRGAVIFETVDDFGS
eukprot:evm.model.scf_2683.1 EVM.evm.TU.scf_2683.1   scf_2683:18861-20161(-)